MDEIAKLVLDIKSLKIQGATNILKSSLAVLKKYFLNNSSFSPTDFKEAVKLLSSARPTEPMTLNCLKYLIKLVASDQKNLLSSCLLIEELIKSVEEKLTNEGFNLLKKYPTFLTHCHSASVENILTKIFFENNNLLIYVTHTEPLHQGRITAGNLISRGIKTVMINDNYGPALLSNNKENTIEAVIIGADVLFSDKGIINKTGSYGLSLSAFFHHLPVYVVASLLKFQIEKPVIEEREGNEIWENHPKNLEIKNPAFDFVPYNFITGLITEAGLVKPENIHDMISLTYPWIKEF